MEQAAAAGISFDALHRRKDGTLFPVEVSSRGAELGGERLLLSVVRDITERKRAEDELRKAMEAAEAANRAKSEFLANMSHEIRTPLAAVLGLVDLLRETPGEPQQQEYLDLIKSSANSLATLVGDILDFSKIEAGKLVLEEQEVELKPLVTEVVSGFLWPAREKGLVLTLEWAPGTPERWYADPTRLRQVLVNLVANAVKFTMQGAVTVRVAAAGGGVRLSVTDTGVGIPADKMNRLFKDFTQVDPSTTREYGGTGLGLIITQAESDFHDALSNWDGDLDKVRGIKDRAGPLLKGSIKDILPVEQEETAEAPSQGVTAAETIECPVCDAPLSLDSTSCPKCGANLAMSGMDELTDVADEIRKEDR
jgi:signal transduction histidine kinase